MHELQFESKSDQTLLRLLVAIEDWENSKIPALNSVSGRELYFSLLSQLIFGKQLPEKPLRTHKGKVTAKAMRQRIRAFESLGLVRIVPAKGDARSKRLIPTAKFTHIVEQQLNNLEILLKKTH